MNAAAEWAKDFFTGVFVELWLRAIPEDQTRREVDFLEKALRLSTGAKVLDVPCGGGRHTLELAGRGYRMTGVDISSEFLAVARSGAAKRGLSVSWEQRSMHDLPRDGTFDAAYCMGNSLGGLDDGELAGFFDAVARTLKSGGRFVVDTGTIAESVLPNLKERFWMPVGDILFLIHNRYDPIRGRLEMEFTFIHDGRMEKKTGFQLVHTYREFSRIVEAAGFHELEGYGSVSMEPYRPGTHQLLLAATKKAT
jgi:SAM-dependent methyltransferase